MKIMMRATRNSRMDNLLIPCMYLTKDVLGRLGSGFLR